MKKIILASTSPRRRELLKQIGLEFEVVGSDYEEDMSLEMNPSELAKYLSRGKAESLVDKFENSIIIAADTFLSLNGEVIGKPNHNIKKAKEILNKISGNTLSVFSGITVIDSSNKKIVSKSVETKVYIKNLSDYEIENYIKTGEPLDKAGAIAIQGLGSIFVEKIEGCYFNVVGLPLFELVQMLKEFNVEII